MIHATWMNAKRKPFDDPRVRRAMHLLFEKQVLVDVVKDVSPLMTGGFIYPFSEFATPKDQLVKRLGYQDDPGAAIKEAKSLLAAAGQSNMRPLDFMVRDLNHHKLFGQAIEAMLREVGIQSNLRTVVESVVVRRCGGRQLRSGGRRHRFDPARSVRLLQRLVPHRRAAELLVLEQRRIRQTGRSDRRRSRCRQASWR